MIHPGLTLLLRAFFIAALLVVPIASAAYPDPGKAPRYFDSDCISKFDRRFVYDFAGVMSTEWGAQIEGAACDIYARTGAHFVLATVSSTDGEILENYALHLFERWGIGQQDRNDGVLLLFVKDYQLDNKPSAVRVEVGYGLEGTIDSFVARDVIDSMREAKANALAGGETENDAISYALASGTLLILQTLNDQYHDGHFPAPRSGVAGFFQSVPWWVWVVGIIVVISIISSLSRSARRPGSGWGYYPGSPHWSSGMGSVFSGGGGFGGGGFGGGGFGGGRSGGGGGSGGL